MAANEYRPVSWNGEAITNSKLNQMANNTQFLFERSPKMRYAAAGLTRDTGLKILAGKTPYPANTRDWSDARVYFGSFFTAGCKPIVTAVVGDIQAGGLRKYISLRGHNGEIDHTGFIAHVVTFELYPGGAKTVTGPGFVHWTAIGY